MKGFIIIIVANKVNKQAYATDSIFYISGMEHAIISNDFYHLEVHKF